MKKLASFGWLLLLIPFISVAGTKTILSSVNKDQSSRELPSFHGIDLSGSPDVYVKFGAKENAQVEGDPDDIKLLETIVENGILKIRTKKSGTWNFGKIKVYVTARSINSINVSGSGDLEVTQSFKSEKLDVAVSGSGSIKMPAKTQTLNAAISGSGEINASGASQKTNIRVSGSGEFNGKDFHTDSADIQVSGSGEASIHAEKTLNALLSGSGEIHYSGNPQVKTVKSGSGRISKI